jgi:gluconate:H+ symporter, GntP family
MNSADVTLILLAFGAIGTLVLLITRFKVNAFISLLLASLAVGAGAVFMGRPHAGPEAKGVAYTMLGVTKSFADGLGATLGGIAAVVALGTMLGRLLAESGGAEVLAKRFAKFFGPQRIQWCIMALALAVGLTTWFAVGLVLLLPILLTLTQETRQPFLRLALPLLACLSVMHGVMPPHPGPVVAVGALKASMGLVLFWGLIIGLPTAAVAGPVWAKFATRWVIANPPQIAEKGKTVPPGFKLPGFELTLFSILLPVLLMLVATWAELWPPANDGLRAAMTFAGNPTIALLIAVLFASWSLGLNCGYRSYEILRFTELSVAAVGMTLLVIGGGGGFARVLRDSGVADAIGRMGESAHLSPLIYGWLVSAFIRVATGSATVAITTASSLLVPVITAHPEINGHQKALIIVAIGCGSLFLSHLNDAGFWMVKDSLGLTVGQTMRTWTVCETIVGIAGMLFSLAAYLVV